MLKLRGASTPNPQGVHKLLHDSSLVRPGVDPWPQRQSSLNGRRQRERQRGRFERSL